MISDRLDSAYQEKCRDILNEEQARSLSETNCWEHVDRARVHADWDAFYKDLSKFIDTSDPTDEHIQGLVHRHHEISCRFYTPSREAYIGMALLYSENPTMRNFHNAYHPGMVAFLSSAMLAYALENL
ncbi:TipAS antibiotic-recognition domain-containing protein [Cupriavidus basilensis]|uniref:TipAS antibiotic-recognition domain-containing protein n=1 Tax=Cupriavidus basilensis TaxID=68895 RepID=A0ABT6ALZ4_9BURK|nr:TipAS antibiotic-recognition domain-containing protein [Cupriavidus basilensis]MDF3833639.1 TipAS antibiotic-recognition domain-containing protein [Cupriavidus basilensis]